MPLGRLIALVVGAAVLVAATVVVANGADREAPSQAALLAAEELLESQTRELEREGIYVTDTTVGTRCVEVKLGNPTEPNREYLRRQVSPLLCVSRRPSDDVIGICGGQISTDIPEGTVTVPDLRRLPFATAARRALAGGLTYTLGCSDTEETRPPELPRYSISRLAMVTRQCPRPGARVPPETEVALAGVAELPGGFRHQVGHSDLQPHPALRGADAPCADGRNVWAITP